jgi:chitosanase
MLTEANRDFIRRTLSVAECGKTDWDPSAIYIYADDNRTTPPKKQITLSIGFTESGNLKKVVAAYLEKGGTVTNLSGYAGRVGRGSSLWNDADFKRLLKEAGKDPIMQQVQRECFDEMYLNPAIEWGEEHGFKEALSYLVIADSYLHSGSILMFLRKRFGEAVPSAGGRERVWIEQYLKARQHWLATHPNKILNNTTYRAVCFLQAIEKDNWGLADSVVMNGTRIA